MSFHKRSEVQNTLRAIAPKIPRHEFEAVVDRVRDSAGLMTAATKSAAWLSLVSYVRHTYTEYDELLCQGYDRDAARFFVAEEIESVLKSWGVQRRLLVEDGAVPGVAEW
jgi:hypothetical protein